jgi:hypothetical protein
MSSSQLWHIKEGALITGVIGATVLREENDPERGSNRGRDAPGRQQLHNDFAGNRAALLGYLRSIERENAERVVTLEPRPAE